MVRGQYIAATGMMLQRKKMEVVTNNLTNVETAGYKKENLISVSFADVLIQRINDPAVVSQRANVGPLNFGTHVDYIDVDHSEGGIEVTEHPFDFALLGDAFFAVETPAGERYTRAGAFFANREGYLCDGEGNYVLGNNGPIFVGDSEFAVDSFGNITRGGALLDSFRLVSFQDTGALRKIGANLYTGNNPEAATNYTLRQGALEMSNVDVGRETVEMMALYRAYEANQRILTMIDETVGKAANEIGRLK